jgi:hypothetical protein
MRSSCVINAVGWCSSVLRGDRVLKYWCRSSYWPSVAILLRITGVFLAHIFDLVVFLDKFKMAAIGEKTLVSHITNYTCMLL